MVIANFQTICFSLSLTHTHTLSPISLAFLPFSLFKVLLLSSETRFDVNMLFFWQLFCNFGNQLLWLCFNKFKYRELTEALFYGQNSKKFRERINVPFRRRIGNLNKTYLSALQQLIGVQTSA